MLIRLQILQWRLAAIAAIYILGVKGEAMPLDQTSTADKSVLQLPLRPGRGSITQRSPGPRRSVRELAKSRWMPLSLGSFAGRHRASPTARECGLLLPQELCIHWNSMWPLPMVSSIMSPLGTDCASNWAEICEANSSGQLSFRIR